MRDRWLSCLQLWYPGEEVTSPTENSSWECKSESNHRVPSDKPQMSNTVLKRVRRDCILPKSQCKKTEIWEYSKLKHSSEIPQFCSNLTLDMILYQTGKKYYQGYSWVSRQSQNMSGRKDRHSISMLSALALLTILWLVREDSCS